jgi:hypothetical protein
MSFEDENVTNSIYDVTNPLSHMGLITIPIPGNKIIFIYLNFQPVASMFSKVFSYHEDGDNMFLLILAPTYPITRCPNTD